jgi:hypothetical protein
MTQQDLDKDFELLQEFINERVDIMAHKLKRGQPCGILTMDADPFGPTAKEIIDIFDKTGHFIWMGKLNEPEFIAIEPITFESWKENR